MAESRIFRDLNKLVFEGAFTLQELHRPLAGIHHAVQQGGYQELILDFTNCKAAYPAPMLALCAQISKLRNSGIEINLKLPKEGRLERLFFNANWSYFLDPRGYDPSTFRGYSQTPATQYLNSKEQSTAVNRIVNSILGAIPEIARADFAALEWAINELTDNVLVHSQSSVGGFVQVSTFHKDTKKVSFIVADAGLGIPTTLREGHPDIHSDLDALDIAIREGVTRDKSLGQGNGLFGSYQICSHSQGFFQLESGYATLTFHKKGGLHLKKEKVPYEGTLVVAEIDFSLPHLLEEALKFGGAKHSPTDFLELNYEDQNAEIVNFKIINEANSFGSRIAGTPIRTKLKNIAHMCPNQKIIVDFSDIALISSSFADEVIGKLFVELGPMMFMSRFQVVGTSRTVQALIDRAINQRIAVGTLS